MTFNYLVYEHAIDVLLCNIDLVVIVEDSDGLRTGQTISCTTIGVIDHNTEVVFGRYLLHQPVGTVALKTVVGSIEGDIMGVSPSVADAFIQNRYCIFKMAFQVMVSYTTYIVKKNNISKIK